MGHILYAINCELAVKTLDLYSEGHEASTAARLYN